LTKKTEDKAISPGVITGVAKKAWSIPFVKKLLISAGTWLIEKIVKKIWPLIFKKSTKTKVMGTKNVGIFTNEMISEAAKKLDGLIVFKNVILETVDGTAWTLILKGLNSQLADKIPEPAKTTISDLVKDIWADKNYESAKVKVADLYFMVVNLKFIEDTFEREIVENIFMLVVRALAKLNTEE